MGVFREKILPETGAAIAVMAVVAGSMVVENTFEPVEHVKLAWAERQLADAAEDITASAASFASSDKVPRKGEVGKDVKFRSDEKAKKGVATLRVKAAKTEEGPVTSYTLRRVGEKVVVNVVAKPEEDGEIANIIHIKTPQSEIIVGGEQENTTPSDLATVEAAADYTQNLLAQFSAVR